MKQTLFFCFLFLFIGTAGAQTVKSIGVAEFAEGIKQKNIHLIDARTPEEYQNGYIKGAKLLNWNNQEQFIYAAKTLDKSKPVYIYCYTDVRSNDAAKWLTKNGFNEVYTLEGGVKAWKANKQPLARF